MALSRFREAFPDALNHRSSSRAAFFAFQPAGILHYPSIIVGLS
jgi:hypothetical protein